jgi:RNA polymerase sigma-70 factor (ECF subfamily)
MNLEELYHCHADFVWRTVRRLGVDDVELSDAVQDVFLTVHTRLAQFEGRSSLKTWLFTICRSVARDRRRRKRQLQRQTSSVAAEEGVDLRADVARAAEHNERVLLLEEILGGLEVDQRNVFVLFEIEKLTGEEISEALSIPLGTVYSRLQSARKAFRQVLTRDEARDRFARKRAGGRP